LRFSIGLPERDCPLSFGATQQRNVKIVTVVIGATQQCNFKLLMLSVDISYPPMRHGPHRAILRGLSGAPRQKGLGRSSVAQIDACIIDGPQALVDRQL
jgi:hypothetical protein